MAWYNTVWTHLTTHPKKYIAGVGAAALAGYLSIAGVPGSFGSKEKALLSPDVVFYVSGQGVRKARCSPTAGAFESPTVIDLGAKFPVKAYDVDTGQALGDYELDIVGQTAQKDFDMAKRRISTNDYFIEVDWSNVGRFFNPEYQTNKRPRAPVYIEGKKIKVYYINGFLYLADFRPQEVVMKVPSPSTKTPLKPGESEVLPENPRASETEHSLRGFERNISEGRKALVTLMNEFTGNDGEAESQADLAYIKCRVEAARETINQRREAFRESAKRELGRLGR